MNLIQKLRSLHTDITASGDGFKIVDAWTTAERLLPRTPVDQAEAKRVLADKDAEGLDALITSLESPASTAKTSRTDEAELVGKFSKDDRDAAIRAFKKRLKLVRLNDESRLGGRYTSGGKTSAVDAIQPPTDFDPQIWKALVHDGKLIDTGGGFYQLSH